MNDHISPHLVVGGNGGKHAKLLLGKAVKKIADCVVGILCYGGIKTLNHRLILHVKGSPGVQNHPARRVDDPQIGREVGVQSIQLLFYSVKGCLIIV